MIGLGTKRRVSRGILPWAPPALVSPRVVEITAANVSNRTIELNTDEDCEIRFLEPIGYTPGPYNAAQDAIVTVVGGRSVIAMGPEFAINWHPETVLTASASTGATTLTVASTEGFPSEGALRINGEGIRYSSKTSTTFTIAERNYGFFLGTGTPPLAFSAGAVVYIAEYARGGLSFRSQTGFVHVEGALIEGSSLLDGVRVRGSSATTVTLQNSLIGPVGPKDIVGMTDGHADCVQTWGSGVKLLRMSHLSLLGGVNGRALINAADTSGGGPVERITLLDSELVDYLGRRQSLLTNSDLATIWTIANAWLVTKKDADLAAPELFASFRREWLSPLMVPMIDRELLGIGYRSPGYAA